MKIKTTLLAICLVTQTSSATNSIQPVPLAFVTLMASVLGFSLNISPRDTKEFLQNNAVGVSIASSIYFSAMAANASDFEAYKDSEAAAIIMASYLVSSAICHSYNKLTTDSKRNNQ